MLGPFDLSTRYINNQYVSPGQPAYVRWNFFTDLTVTVGGVTWVRGGALAM